MDGNLGAEGQPGHGPSGRGRHGGHVCRAHGKTGFIKQMKEIMQVLRETFGMPMDVEFASNRNNLYILQIPSHRATWRSRSKSGFPSGSGEKQALSSESGS